VLDFAEQAFRADPTDPRARNIAAVANFVMGGIASDAKEWEKAVHWYKRSYEIESDETTLALLKQCAQDANQLDILGDVCEARLKACPDDHPVRLTLGIAYVKMAIDRKFAPGKEFLKAELLRRLTSFWTALQKPSRKRGVP
jgi:hypothetical protein